MPLLARELSRSRKIGDVQSLARSDVGVREERVLVLVFLLTISVGLLLFRLTLLLLELAALGTGELWLGSASGGGSSRRIVFAFFALLFLLFFIVVFIVVVVAFGAATAGSPVAQRQEVGGTREPMRIERLVAFGAERTIYRWLRRSRSHRELDACC